jgi:glycosyltransferase involved in cell wall biosynthesis
VAAESADDYACAVHVALYFNGRLPVRTYGGTQRVVLWLAQGLAELGHTVSLLAPRGSRSEHARVVPLDPRAMRAPGFDLTPLLPGGTDLLHLHAPVSRAPSAPHLFTWHGNARAGEVLPAQVVFLSADHARRHGRGSFVYNGLDPSGCRFGATKASYDLFLGRLHRAKGVQWAIEGARRSGRRLVIAGGWRPSLSKGIRYVGQVGGERKAELLADAACLWMPAQWDEPFGLTLIEAMASGTPVLGTRRGALPEIVSPDVGALGDSLDELVALRPSCARCDPATCRARVERCFTHRTMAAEYLRMYHTLLSSGNLPEGRVAPPV